jgi:hypothetical protein
MAESCALDACNGRRCALLAQLHGNVESAQAFTHGGLLHLGCQGRNMSLSEAGIKAAAQTTSGC